MNFLEVKKLVCNKAVSKLFDNCNNFQSKRGENYFFEWERKNIPCLLIALYYLNISSGSFISAKV